MEQRIYSLDILRFFSAIFVVIFHFLLINFHYNINFEIISSIAVEIFFVLSGFVLAPQLLNFFELNKKKYLKVFLLRRWLRTIPAFWISLIFMSSITYDFNFYDFFLYALFFQNLFNNINNFDYFIIAWSLAIEEWFYIIFPIYIIYFSKIFKKIKISKPLFFSLLFIIFFLILKIFHYSGINNWGETERKIVIFRLDSICYGFILFLFYKKLEQFNSFLMLLFLIIFLYLQYISYFKIVFEFNYLFKIIFSLVTAITSSLIILLFVKFNSLTNHIPNYLSLWMGNISYSMYLFHLPLILLMSKYVTNNYLLFILYFTIQIFFSILFFNYFEKPILRMRPKYK